MPGPVRRELPWVPEQRRRAWEARCEPRASCLQAFPPCPHWDLSPGRASRPSGRAGAHCLGVSRV